MQARPQSGIRPTQFLLLILLTSFLAGAPSALAQGTLERPQLVGGTVRVASTLESARRARVVLEQRGSIRGELFTDSNGKFNFFPVGPGEYVLNVSLAGFKPARVTVNVTNSSVRGVLIYLETESSADSVRQATVSVQELALSDKARREYDKGLKELRQGRYDSSITRFRNVIALHPQFAHAHYALGVGLYSRAQHEEAEKTLRKAIELNEGLTEAYVLLGRLLNDRRRSQEAEPVLLQALVHRRDRWEAFYEMARACVARRDWTAAEENLRQAHALDGAGPPVHILFANVLVTTGSYAGALQEMQHYLQVDPHGPFASEVRAKASALAAELQKQSKTKN